MKYTDAHVCMGCQEVFELTPGQTTCPDCGERHLRPLRRALLEGRKLSELPDLLTEEEFAWWLGVERVTVQGWRYEGLVPDYMRIGRLKGGPIRYDHQSIDRYLESRRTRLKVG